MLSRQGENAQLGFTSFSDAFPAEEVSKLEGYFLPWIKASLETAEDELIWKRPTEGVNSIGNLLLHLEGNVRQWMIHGVGGAEDHRDRDSEFSANDGPDRWTLYNKLAGTVSEACVIILKRRTEEQWLETIRIQSYDTTALASVIHVVEHFAYHTGQIVTMVKCSTGKDLHFYDL
jgi:uncharacterized damage-inducible protein DinB